MAKIENCELPRKCSRFIRCSVNCCPLDHMAEQRPSISGDPERTCKAPLRNRLEIGNDMDLPWGGMTKEERDSGRSIADLIAEDDTHEANRQAAGERGKEALKAALERKKGLYERP